MFEIFRQAPRQVAVGQSRDFGHRNDREINGLPCRSYSDRLSMGRGLGNPHPELSKDEARCYDVYTDRRRICGWNLCLQAEVVVVEAKDIK